MWFMRYLQRAAAINLGPSIRGSGFVRTAKTFVEHENQFAHNVLAGSLKPYQIFRFEPNVVVTTAPVATTELPQHILQPPPPTTTTRTGKTTLCADFDLLVDYCIRTGAAISDGRFEAFSRHYCDNVHHLSDEELLESLRCLQKLPTPDSPKAPNYIEIWNTLDIECCRRIDRWPTAQLLLTCDAWYQLGLARIGEFVWEAMRKLGRRVRKMPPEQLVQSMFLCNVMRRPVLSMFDFELNLARCVPQVTLPELGVMAMGFFKTQTPIRSPELLDAMYGRLVDELDTVEDITLVAMLKVLRYSSKLPQVPAMHRLQHALRAQVDRVSLVTCLHMALLGCELQTCDDPLIERILHRFEGELENTRLKDLERICLVMALFNFNSVDGVADRLTNRLLPLLRQRVDEIVRHPRCYTNCLQFLTMRGVHDEEMLASALAPRFVRHAYPGGLPGREYFHLDSFARLLGDGSYAGPLLSERQRQTMGKLYTLYIPERNSRFKLNSTDRILLEIRDTAASAFRETSLKHILPQYERCDLLICYDRQQRRALPLNTTTCPEDYSGVILTRQHLLGDQHHLLPHIQTIVVVVAGWNNVIREKQRHTGQFDLKLRQLRQLGHQPVVIYWHEWRELETSADRLDFLRRRLNATAINIHLAK